MTVNRYRCLGAWPSIALAVSRPRLLDTIGIVWHQFILFILASEGRIMSTVYARAREYIRQLIEDYRAEDKDLIPTETELMNQIDVGRNTIRRAIDSFVEAGILSKVQGKGTFIVSTKSTVAFAGWTGTEPPGDEVMDGIISRFYHSNPDITIEYQATPYYQTLDTIVRDALMGRAADVVQIVSHWLPLLYPEALLQPLDRFINQNHLRRRFQTDIDSGRVGNDIYALSWGLSPLLLYCNRNVLSDTGLEPDSPPRTLDELLGMCEAIAAHPSAVEPISVPLTGHDPNYLWLYPYFLAFGGGFSNATGDVIIDSDENVNALEWLTRLARTALSNGTKGVIEGRMMFATNQIAFWLDGSWIRGLLRDLSGEGHAFDDQYMVVPVPVGPSGRSESILWSHMLGISRQCKKPDIAYRVIEYLTSNEDVAKYALQYLGMLPPTIDLLHRPWFREDPLVNTAVRQLHTASTLPFQHPLFDRTEPIISQTIAQTIATDADSRECMSFLRRVIAGIAQTPRPIFSGRT